MDIDDLIEEKTQSFTGDGGYYFTYVTPEDCKKIVEQALKQDAALLTPVANVKKSTLCQHKWKPLSNSGEVMLICTKCDKAKGYC